MHGPFAQGVFKVASGFRLEVQVPEREGGTLGRSSVGTSAVVTSRAVKITRSRTLGAEVGQEREGRLSSKDPQYVSLGVYS